jgi:hypothetical protein
MPSHKNQHFVPRCHLAPFTVGYAGAAINVFNVGLQKGIRNAPVKGQCSKSYFYGKDLSIEKILQGGEELYGRLLRDIMSPNYSLTDSDSLLIKRFICLQNSRTEMAAQRRALATGDMRDAIFSTRAVKEEIDLSENAIIVESLRTCVRSWYIVDDLKVCLLKNKTNHSFITSDDPAIVTNRLYIQKMKQQKFGLGSAGTLLILPLTPRICALCFDGDVYSVTNTGGWAVLNKISDILAMNEQQYLKCGSNIYFPKWDELPRIAAGFRDIAGRRLAQPWDLIVADFVAADEFRETFKVVPRDEATRARRSMVNLSLVYPAPCRWPSVIRYRLNPFGFTNGSSVGLIRKCVTETYILGGLPFEKKYL